MEYLIAETFSPCRAFFLADATQTKCFCEKPGSSTRFYRISRLIGARKYVIARSNGF